MNICGVAKLLGDVELAKVRNGQLIVSKINELLPDGQKISITFTGNQLMEMYDLLPSVLQKEIDQVTVATLTESIAMTSDVRAANIEKDGKPNGKGYIMIILGVVLALVALSIVFTYVYLSIKNGEMPKSDILATLVNLLGDLLKVFVEQT